MIDTHSHLFAEEFADDLPQVIERAKAAGVRKVFVIRCWVFTRHRWTVIIKPA